MRFLTSYILVAVIAIVCTAWVIYATPLRYTSLVPPAIHEVSPRSFYNDYSLHPENYMFIDVRPAAEYVGEHAKGSVNIPLASLYDVWSTLPRHGKTIALICGNNSASGVAYGYLEHLGFSNLIRITGGVPAWVASGLPVEGTHIANSTSTSPVSCIQTTTEV